MNRRQLSEKLLASGRNPGMHLAPIGFAELAR